MDRMNPPPNYYGAMYPNGNSMNAPYQANNANMTTPPPMNGNMDSEPAAVRETVQNETYQTISSAVNGVKDFYNAFRELVNNNIGKDVKIYCAFTDSALWHDKVFEGNLIAAADNYLMIKDKDTNKYTIIASVYVIYVEMM